MYNTSVQLLAPLLDTTSFPSFYCSSSKAGPVQDPLPNDRQTRWKIFLLRSPTALLAPQRQLQRHSLREELVADPILRVRPPIQGRALDVYVPVRRVEVDVADRGGFVGLGVRDAHGFEERGHDEVDVLARVGEQAHHGEDGEGAHGAGIVVPGQPAVGCVERGRYVTVGAEGREGGAAGVVVLEDREEDGLIADVG